MSKKATPRQVETSVDYEASLVRRAGELMVVVTKQTWTTPISGRGREWDQRTSVTETTVLTPRQAHELAKALGEAFLYGALDAAQVQTWDEPEYHLMRVLPENGPDEDELVGSYWSWNEAQEAGLDWGGTVPLDDLYIRLPNGARYPVTRL